MYKIDIYGNGSDFSIAMNDAIDDGVDIMNVSLGEDKPMLLIHDEVATAAFRAIEKGILVCACARNEGPFEFSMQNDCPWILTVGASGV